MFFSAFGGAVFEVGLGDLEGVLTEDAFDFDCFSIYNALFTRLSKVITPVISNVS